MTKLSPSYVIIINRAINLPGHRNNVVDELNTTGKRYLNKQVELIGKLGSNNTTNIGIITSDSKYVSVKFTDQCLHILHNKETLN